jgi:hypothetical protein
LSRGLSGVICSLMGYCIMTNDLIFYDHPAEAGELFPLLFCVLAKESFL